MEHNNNGCGFVVMLAALVVAFVVVWAFALSSIGVAPVINGNGLSWDNTAYVTHEANRTQQFIVQQQEMTKQSANNNETARTIAIVLAVFGVLALAIAQWGITRRQQMRIDAMVRLHIAQAYPHGQIERRNGIKVLVDYERHEIVPYSVIQQEVDADWRQL